MKNTILKKDEEIERLKSLNTSVSGISKLNQKPSSGSFKQLEVDTQQPIDDHIQQNQFLHQSENTRGEEALGFPDADFNERSSDTSDNGLALGTDTDGSSANFTVTEATKKLEKMEK